MANFTVFVDGHEGTTGLEIHERLQKRSDVQILTISAEKRKDISERRKLLNQADVIFLCLPDDAARESVSLIDNPATRVLDGSTAHRIIEGWDYGIPELSQAHRDAIARSKRVSVPGCYATGFTMLMYPLVTKGYVPADYPVSCHAITGYSGGGRKLISIFESEENSKKLNSPCFYALALHHKHLPEMRKHSGLQNPPLFTPIISKFYRGMIVAVPLHAEHLGKKTTAAGINEFYRNYYQGQNFVKVRTFNVQDEFEWGYMNAETCNNTNNIEILVFGDDQHILVASRLDNLGKGASGAAVQNMNIMLGLDETASLI